MSKFLFPVVILLLLAGCHDDWWCESHDWIYYGWPSDINGDGYADIVVGAPLDDAGAAGSDRGRVFLYAGRRTPGGGADQVYSGTEDGGRFGASIAVIGDYNGDGYSDFAVGAPFEAGGGTRRGRVHLFFGGPSFPAAASWTLNGHEDDGRFGWAVARAGDVDGDGRDELLVGAPFESGGGIRRGRAHLYSFVHGTSPLLTFSGSEDESGFGWALDTAGDFDGDGYFDVAVGAPFDDADGNSIDEGRDRGCVFLYRGGRYPDNSVDLVLAGGEDGAWFGASVAGLMDFNVDGYDDVAVGAPWDDADGNGTDDHIDAGRGFIYYGHYSLDGVADLVLSGGAGSGFGFMVARIGDVNNGGAPDLLVGAPYEDAGGTERGCAYVYFGGAPPDGAADLVMSGGEDGGHFGFSGFSGGDVNAGGARDLVVGAPDDDGDGNIVEDGLDRGRVFLFYGGPSMDAVVDLTITGTENGARSGAAVQ